MIREYIPSDIEYKDQGLTPQELRCGERVQQSSRRPDPPIGTNPQQQQSHQQLHQQEVPSTLEYKDQGLTLEEIQQQQQQQASNVPRADPVPNAGSSSDDNNNTNIHQIAAPVMVHAIPVGEDSSVVLQAKPANNDNDMVAKFWKNPTARMIENATQTDAMGGILFANSSGTGKFTVPRTIYAGHILARSTLDLSRADFVFAQTVIRSTSIVGGFRLIVPRGVRVEAKGMGIVGSFRGPRLQSVDPEQDAPRVVLQGFSILGAITVKVNEDVPPVQVIE